MLPIDRIKFVDLNPPNGGCDNSVRFVTDDPADDWIFAYDNADSVRKFLKSELEVFMKKTLIVFSGGETGDCPKLYMVDGNLSHLNDIVLGSGSSPEYYKKGSKEAELALLLFGPDGTGDAPTAMRVNGGPIFADIVISCAFVP